MPLSPAVLIVESNEGHRFLVEERIRKVYSKVVLFSAASISEAMEVLPRHEWQLIIVNSQLPDGKGTEFLRLISRQQPYAAVIILTDDPNEEIGDHSEHCGLVELLVKDRRSLDAMASQIKRLMSTSRRLSHLLNDGKQVRADSDFFDALTGLYTRAYFDEALQREIARANRYQSCFAILIVDVDQMARLNSRKGKAMGDRCLKRVAAVMKESIRTGDILARYGGDEFVIILDRCLPLDAIQCSHRIIDHVTEASTTARFTVTVGLLHYEGKEKIARPQQLVLRTTRAIQQAQQKGGNRLIVAA